MSRRDRRHEAPMSFFSFQDIICCVTGVLVLITLLMAIELARRPQTLGVNAQTTSLDWVTLNSQLKEAEKHRDNLTASLSRTQATLTQLSKTAVLTPGMLTDLRRRVEALRRSLQQQEASNSETQAEQARLAKEVSATQETRDALAETYGIAQKDLSDALGHLVQAGKIEKISSELYFHQSAFTKACGRLTGFLKSNGTVTTQQLKEMFGISRKFLIPLAEHFDATKLTVRIGPAERKLRGG